MPDPPQTERNTGLAVQLGLQLSQRQIGFRGHPIHDLTLRLGTCPPLTPWLVRHALGLPSAVPLCGNLFRPAHAHQKAIRQLLQRLLALIVGQQKLTAQVIPIWLRHRFTRRRVSPNLVYTIKENALRAALSTEGGTDARYDFVPFRSSPLYAIDEGKLVPSDIAFILEKSHAGVQWAIHDALPVDSKKRHDLFTAWGLLFEEYVHWLLGGMRTSIPLKYIPTPQWDSGGESFDGLLLRDSVLAPVECKGGFLSRNARYSGNKDIFLDDVEKKFVPGCDQLAKKIGALFPEDAATRRCLHDLPLDHIRAVIPMLVVQDHILRVPFFNWYMNQKFQQSLSRFELRPDIFVRPLTVVNIQELESMVNSAEATNFDFVYALHNRTVRDEEVLSDLLDWLLQLPDFGRQQSSRMRQIHDELHGPMFTYLFPKSAAVV